MKVSNRQLKQILENTVNSSKKDRAEKLDDRLQGYQTSFKTHLWWWSPYQLVYGKTCNYQKNYQHKGYWAIKFLNSDLTTSGKN